MVLSEIFRGNNEVREAARAGVQIDTVSVANGRDSTSEGRGSVWLVRQMQQARQTAAAKSLAQYVRQRWPVRFIRLTAPRSNS